MAQASGDRLLYNFPVKSWDVIIVGGGIIGLSLAISLRKQALRVLVVERSEPGREASSAAAGMLVGCGTEIPEVLKVLAAASAEMYPEFVHELEDESGLKVDLRDQGTIVISRDGKFPERVESLSSAQLSELEPELAIPHGGSLRAPSEVQAAVLKERSVDPRKLVAAAIKASRHRGVDISSGSEVKAILVSGERISGVQTDKASYFSGPVVNCAGAWSGCLSTPALPVHPVKGQMLAVVGAPALRRVVRGEAVYLVPRSDGRIVIGSTLENAGYDKRTNVNAIQKLFEAAVELMPALAKAKKHEDWTGLRPGTPDSMPILGECQTHGYFVASGHYRDGILLASITARLMTELILGKKPAYDLTPFSPYRFRSASS